MQAFLIACHRRPWERGGVWVASVKLLEAIAATAGEVMTPMATVSLIGAEGGFRIAVPGGRQGCQALFNPYIARNMFLAPCCRWVERGCEVPRHNCYYAHVIYNPLRYCVQGSQGEVSTTRS